MTIVSPKIGEKKGYHTLWSIRVTLAPFAAACSDGVMMPLNGNKPEGKAGNVRTTRSEVIQRDELYNDVPSGAKAQVL